MYYLRKGVFLWLHMRYCVGESIVDVTVRRVCWHIRGLIGNNYIVIFEKYIDI